jgi:ribosomal protein S11
MEKRKAVRSGNVNIQLLQDNIVVTFLDLHGNVVAWSSSLVLGFEGELKVAPEAAKKVAEAAMLKAMEAGMVEVDVYIKDESGAGANMTESIRGAVDTIVGSAMNVEIVKHRTQARVSEDRKIGKEVYMLEEYIKRAKEWLDDLF